MNTQESPFEDIYEAYRDCCRSIGGKAWAKTIGSMLWPAKMPDDAGKLLNNCLDKNRSEKLDPEQTLFILKEARKSGCHSAINYICEISGYRSPEPIEPIDEMAELQREYIGAVETMRTLTEKMEQAQIRVGRDLKSVSGK